MFSSVAAPAALLSTRASEDFVCAEKLSADDDELMSSDVI